MCTPYTHCVSLLWYHHNTGLRGLAIARYILAECVCGMTTDSLDPGPLKSVFMAVCFLSCLLPQSVIIACVVSFMNTKTLIASGMNIMGDMIQCCEGMDVLEGHKHCM